MPFVLIVCPVPVARAVIIGNYHPVLPNDLRTIVEGFRFSHELHVIVYVRIAYFLEADFGIGFGENLLSRAEIALRKDIVPVRYAYVIFHARLQPVGCNAKRIESLVREVIEQGYGYILCPAVPGFVSESYVKGRRVRAYLAKRNLRAGPFVGRVIRLKGSETAFGNYLIPFENG